MVLQLQDKNYTYEKSVILTPDNQQIFQNLNLNRYYKI